jgi:hypothetical protein
MKTWKHIRTVNENLSANEYKVFGYRMNMPEHIANRVYGISDVELLFELGDGGLTFVKPYIQLALFKNFDPNAMSQNLFSNAATSPQEVLNCLAYMQNDQNITDSDVRLTTMQKNFNVPNHYLENLVIGDQLYIGVLIFNMDPSAQTVAATCTVTLRMNELP